MDYVIAFAGLVLIAAPWLFGYSTNYTAMSSSIVLGAIVLVVNGYRALARDTAKWEEWIAGICGLIAIAIPFFFFRFSMAAIWSSVVLGIIIAALAAYQLFAGPPSPSGTGAQPRTT